MGDTAYFANIFTAQAEEDITAVAFYTPSLNAQYKILLYKGVGNTPVSGSALSSQSGSINIPGYHTITLSQPVRVKQGEKFSVVVKLTTPGNNYPVAIEYPYPGFSSRATARSGESYVSSNGVVWTDLTTQYSNSNVCLKAFSSRLGQTTQTQSTTPTSTPIQTPTPRDTSPPSVTMTSPVSYASDLPGRRFPFPGPHLITRLWHQSPFSIRPIAELSGIPSRKISQNRARIPGSSRIPQQYPYHKDHGTGYFRKCRLAVPGLLCQKGHG